MKTEYLITFDSSKKICIDVKGFKSLLSSHEDISFNNKTTIKYRENEYHYLIATGKLPDNSIYYDLTLEVSDDTHLTDFKNLLRDIRTICRNSSNRNVIVLIDGIGGSYCEKGYPVIYKTENLMRKLISKFMAISIGVDWEKISVPDEVSDSIRKDRKTDNENLLFQVDFIQLSSFLFKPYTKNNSNKFFDSVKDMDDEEEIKVSNLKQYVPFTNWEKYFATKVNCNSEYLRTKWDKLYEYRCKIAHCRVLKEDEYSELIAISDDVCGKIEQALESIGDLHIDAEERENLAENISSVANIKVAEFISSYNKLTETIGLICENVSGSDDIYYKDDTNKTNIRMQVNYLAINKEVFDRELAKKIINIQTFRNRIVHNFGLAEVDNQEISDQMAIIDYALGVLMGKDVSEYEKLKNMDFKNGAM